jgi:DNA-binding PadR family transcriptional regulator
MPRSTPPHGRPGRLLGIYALSVMAREGPIHGYQLSQRISERTQGSWQPGAGAIYPALKRLTERGFATAREEGSRNRYSITAKGRLFLRHMVQRVSGARESVPDTTVLWMEIVGEGDQGRYVLRHLRTHLDQAERYAEKVAGTPTGREFRKDLAAEFARLDGRLRRLSRLPARSSRPRQRRAS